MIWRFLVDEDLPRITAQVLVEAGYEAEDVRAVGLRGHNDSEVFAYAQAHGQIVVSADKGFTNTLRFPLGSHAGIVVVRVPDALPTAKMHQELLGGLASLTGKTLTGALVIVEIDRVRVRWPLKVIRGRGDPST
jgi:predicted nuclease of predicted toxin-antitoxin system